MDDHLDFLVYCLEEYKNFAQLSGKETFELFRQSNVFDFILTNYNALHTTGNTYIVNDINKWVATH